MNKRKWSTLCQVINAEVKNIIPTLLIKLSNLRKLN
jgi:hypothetical protein